MYESGCRPALSVHTLCQQIQNVLQSVLVNDALKYFTKYCSAIVIHHDSLMMAIVEVYIFVQTAVTLSTDCVYY